VPLNRESGQISDQLRALFRIGHWDFVLTILALDFPDLSCGEQAMVMHGRH
jgi:hypothetical protein